MYVYGKPKILEWIASFMYRFYKHASLGYDNLVAAFHFFVNKGFQHILNFHPIACTSLCIEVDVSWVPNS